jgi:hypothetical protein
MYNTKFVCTYKSYSDCFLSDTFFRKDILNIFKIDDLDFEKHESEINDEVANIFEKIKTHKKFMECIKKAQILFPVTDEIVGLMCLMSYEFLYLSHPCISEFLEEGKISDEKIDALMNHLSSQIDFFCNF